MREPVAMASAIYRMAEGAASSEDREVREVAWLVRQFFEDELWRFKTLDAFLGLRRQGGGLSRAAPVAARNTALRELGHDAALVRDDADRSRSRSAQAVSTIRGHIMAA